MKRNVLTLAITLAIVLMFLGSCQTAQGFYDRGYAHFNKEDWDKAIVDFTQAIKLEPDFAEAYYDRGYTHTQEDDYDKAIADYETVLRIDPNNGYARLFLENVLGQ